MSGSVRQDEIEALCRMRTPGRAYALGGKTVEEERLTLFAESPALLNQVRLLWTVAGAIEHKSRDQNRG